MRTLFRFCTCLLVVAGCAEQPPADKTPAATPTVSVQPADTAAPTPGMFAGLPLIPGSRVVGGTASAAEAVVTIPASADSAASFYRRVLIDRGWDIRGDATDASGQVTLHARSDAGRPIWVLIRPAGATRSEVSVIATTPDTAAAAH